MKKLILISIILLAATLRLYALDKYPLGLNADEAAIGYNAYSLLLTGHDEHNAFWPLVFRSFDDFKPPFYFYLVLPFVKFIGLNIWAVRLPSALLGTLSVYLTFLLAKNIFKNKNIGYLSALILALSPWHLHFSRGGWEVNAATTFLLLGLVAFFKGLDRPKYFLLSALALVASLYTYHSMRVIIPLLGLVLLVLYFSQLRSAFQDSKPFRFSLIGSTTLATLLLLPLILQMLSPSGQSRFTGVSVFADQGPLWEALELRRDHPGPLANAFHNRYLTYGVRFAKNYFSHFSPRFLFITGDEIARSNVPGMGQLLLVFLPFFYLGFFKLLKRPDKSILFLLFWLGLAPLAAALTFQSPHALRAQNMSIPLAIVIAYGLYVCYQHCLKFKYLFLAAVILLFAYDSSRYLHQYYIHYPKEAPTAWQGGFGELISYIKPIQDQYDNIVISDTYDQPYIITAFFLQYPPDKLQQEIVLEPRDKFGFSTVRRFGKYSFKHVEGQDFTRARTLVVTTTESAPDGVSLKKTITAPGGQTLFSVWDTLQ